MNLASSFKEGGGLGGTSGIGLIFLPVTQRSLSIFFIC